MKQLQTLLLLVLASAPCVLAQVPADRSALLNGEETGQGGVAELNGYPSPRRVLALADTLRLTKEQRAAVEALAADITKRAKEIGKQVVRIEEELNESFAEGLMSDNSVRNNCDEIGRLRGKLRALFLAADMKCKALLTEKQNALCRNLRTAKRR